MKNIIFTFGFILLFSAPISLNAQHSPIYDRVEAHINNIDTIPDFKSKANKLKLTGIIYQSDGITPAKDVILYIEQPNEDGDFDLRKSGKDRYVFHRSWVKTNADGRYTFYTFVPGNDRRYNQLQQIFPIIKQAAQPEVQLASLLFNNDPLLTKRCRKRIAKKEQKGRILSTQKENGILVAHKDIILPNATKPIK